MKTADLLLLGAVGVAAYFLVTRKAAAEPTGYASSGGVPVIAVKDGAANVTVAKSIPEAIAAVNVAQQTGARIVGTSRTITRGVTATVGGGSYSGNVAILGGQTTPSFIGIRQPARDAAGLTATDRLILRNAGLAPTTQNARNKGLL